MQDFEGDDVTKNEAIRIINRQLGANALGRQNTHWSNIVPYGRGEGWWLNIPFHKFKQDLHLILNSATEAKFIHVKVPANSILEPRRVFRNKDDSADIFIPSSGKNRFIDVQAGSSKHDFGAYAATETAHG